MPEESYSSKSDLLNLDHGSGDKPRLDSTGLNQGLFSFLK